MYLMGISHAISNNDIRIRTFSLGPEHTKESYLLIFETDFVYTSDFNRVLSVVQKKRPSGSHSYSGVDVSTFHLVKPKVQFKMLNCLKRLSTLAKVSFITNL